MHYRIRRGLRPKAQGSYGVLFQPVEMNFGLPSRNLKPWLTNSGGDSTRPEEGASRSETQRVKILKPLTELLSPKPRPEPGFRFSAQADVGVPVAPYGLQYSNRYI